MSTADRPEMTPKARHSSNVIRYTVAALSLLILTIVISMGVRHVLENRLRNESNRQLENHKRSIIAATSRLHHLPFAATLDPRVVKLLQPGGEISEDGRAIVAEESNQYLESVAQSANASLFYIIDKSGNTLASSNWRASNSLVGKNFSFRPYFRNALQRQDPGYFAIGLATAEAGYYYAHPAVIDNEIHGVVVVKTELESLQKQWQSSNENLLAFDEFGVSVLASKPEWRFKTMLSAPLNELNQLRDEFKYANNEISPLLENVDVTGGKITLDGKNYIITRSNIGTLNWQLWLLKSSDSLNTATWLSVMGTLMIASLSTTLLLYRREKARRHRLSEAAKDAANMRRLNELLEDEIADRKKAEEELHEAQAELIQTSKLAALGKMSAAIVHEVNQPLAAIKTFGASAKLLLDRGETDAVKNNLNEIRALTERLATITSDLKLFARKSNGIHDKICLQESLENSLKVIQPTFDSLSISIYRDLPAEPVYVSGTGIRIEQVITNLLCNAADATRARESNRKITLKLFIDDDEAALRVIDNGTGLNKHTLEHLFDPFFTTKPVGEGVGLGLAISYANVQEMGGTIRVRNNEDAGALFSLRLKLFDSSEQSIAEQTDIENKAQNTRHYP